MILAHFEYDISGVKTNFEIGEGSCIVIVKGAFNFLVLDNYHLYFTLNSRYRSKDESVKPDFLKQLFGCGTRQTCRISSRCANFALTMFSE